MIFKHLFIALLAISPAVWAQQTPEQVCGPSLQTRDAGLNEACVRVQVSVKTMYGVERTDSMLLTHFKPKGEGPFPLVVMNP